MVMRIEEIRQTNTAFFQRKHRCTRGASSHTGQDPQCAHGRDHPAHLDLQGNDGKRYLNEIVLASSISIDVQLLTGDLDEDISILNIVA